MTLVERIIQYANQEVSEGKEILDCPWPDNLDRGRGPRFREGRVEFAEGLLAKIKEWQDEDEYEMGQARLRLSQ